MKFIAGFFLFLAFNFTPFNSSAQSGSADPSFNTQDDCTYGNGESFDQYVNVTAIQSDGKVLTGGSFTMYNGDKRNGIARLHKNGALDQSFNPGKGCTDIFTSYNPVAVNALAIQSDGKIIIGGNFLKYNGTYCFGLARLNSDGSLDKSFNVGSGLNAPAFKILIQPDGKILVAGNFTTFNGVSRSRIARLHTNGSLDTTFKPGTGFNNYVRTMTLLNNGKIMVGGMFGSYNGNTCVRIARLKPDGSFDAAFATGTGFQSEVTTILPIAGGKMVVMGHFINYKSTYFKRIVQIDSNGNIDNSLKSGDGFSEGVYDGFIQPDGKIVAVGAFITYDNKTQNRILRLHPNGSLDTTFKSPFSYVVGDIVMSANLENSGHIIISGEFSVYNSDKNVLNFISRLNTDGSVEKDYNHGTGFQVAQVSSISVQNDSKILCAGTFYSYNGYISACLARLKPDGAIDSTFKSIVKSGGTIHSINLQPDGKIIATGGFAMHGNTIMSIARFNTDGSLDTTFKIGNGCNSHAYTNAIQSDGKILFGGSFSLFKDTAINRIVRVHSNGIIDNSFNTGVGFNDVIHKILVQSDGKIIVCGRFTKYQNISYPGIIRLLSDGRIDSSFIVGTGLTNAYPSSGTPFGTSICLQTDNKIIVVGNFTRYNNNSSNGIVRVLSNGRYDSSFSVGPGFNTIPYEAIVQSDGKVLVVGNFSTYRTVSRNGIVRILSTGSIDQTYNPGTGFDRYTRAIAFHDGNKVLVGGEFTKYNGACRTRIARLFDCESIYVNTVSNCGPYQWLDGKTYQSSTKSPYIKLSNANHNGCDSFVVLNLTVNQARNVEQVIKSCGSYKWIDGITYNSSVDTVKHVISGGASNGCDSIIALKLTINQPTMSYDGITACKQYKWIDGKTYTASNNTATYTYPGAAYNGCDSIVKLSLGIINVTTTVSKNLTILTSNEFAAVYQWLNCDSAMKPIAGATDRTFEPTVSGNYAVMVTKDGCTDTSDCIEVVVDNSNILSPESLGISIYPNPSDGRFIIESDKLNGFEEIIVRNNLGSVVNTWKIKDSNTIEIDLGGLKGIFYIEITGPENIVCRKKLVIL